MEPGSEKAKQIRNAALIALSGNAALSIIKIIAGFLSGSGALVADGVDSMSDTLIAVITLVIVKIITKPADMEHPWGHGRAETVATVALSFIIFFMGGQLVISGSMRFFSGESGTVPSTLALIVTVLSIAGKSLLAWSQYTLGKRADSAMIMANGKNMASDVWISAGVLAGFILTAVTGSMYADIVVEILIGMWVVKTAVSIFMEANQELMDGSTDMEVYKVVLDAVERVEGAYNPHRARMRRIAGFWDIDLDIEVDSHLTVHTTHHIASQVEAQIRTSLETVFDIMVHVEPRGDDGRETYGLSEQDMSLLGK